MAIYDFACPICGWIEEHIVSPSISDPIPEKCPRCNEGKMERQFSPQRISFDVINGFDYQYGRKNWKKGKSDVEIAGYLNPDENSSQSGLHYKDPY